MTDKPLLVLDLGGTIGRVVGKGAHPADILQRLTPYGFHHQIVHEEVRRTFNVVSELDEAVARQVCDRLLIPREEFPGPWPLVSFEFYEDARNVLQELSDIGTVVALTNQSVTAKPAMQYIMSECGAHLKRIFASYDLGDNKPARWLWKYVAEEMGHKVSDIVHIGNSFTEDVLAPLSAGALGAVWVHDGNADCGQVSNRCEQVPLLRNVPDTVSRMLRIPEPSTFTGGGV